MLKNKKNDNYWERRSVCSNVSEIIEKEIPMKLGNYVTLTNNSNANLYHTTMITSCSVTGIFHLLNRASIELYAKRNKRLQLKLANNVAEFLLLLKHVVEVILYISVYSNLSQNVTNSTKQS